MNANISREQYFEGGWDTLGNYRLRVETENGVPGSWEKEALILNALEQNGYSVRKRWKLYLGAAAIAALSVFAGLSIGNYFGNSKNEKPKVEQTAPSKLETMATKKK